MSTIGYRLDDARADGRTGGEEFGGGVVTVRK